MLKLTNNIAPVLWRALRMFALLGSLFAVSVNLGSADSGPSEIVTDTDEGDDHTEHDGGDGAIGGHRDGDIVLPTTKTEIEAFVASIRALEIDGDHMHGHTTAMATEHMSLLELVSPASASHIAIGNGSWFDSDNWHNGQVPDAGSMVMIPGGVHIEYDNVSDVEIFTLRVDGQVDFATDTDSKIVVDTFIIAPTGKMTAGTAETPVQEGVSVDIVFAGGEPIDVEWDPDLLSRGFLSHGETEIFGQAKDSHEKVIEDPVAGDTSVTFDALPEGWAVGDKIVIAGTHYDGYDWDNSVRETVYFGTEDEVRFISKIEGNVVHFAEPLEYHHDTPADDLQASVANYSRSVTFRSEDGDEAELYERGHVMLLHSDEIDIRYATFEDLGRTDKSVDLHGTNDTEGDAIDFDSNVNGRYSLHLHRTGLEDQDNPAILDGNAVYNSPGWGIVHHDSHAVIENNATFDTFGAGYVAETGNETGSWVDNIAINAQGQSWGLAKNFNGGENFGTSGDGFWFSGRLVESSGNIAASVNHGHIYFHRVAGKESFDADYFDFAEALGYIEDVTPTQTPILLFEDNEAYAARLGLHVVKANPAQNHDIHSVIDGFTAWNVDTGVFLEYTSHYLIFDFRAIGEVDGETGIVFGNNVYGQVVVDAEISGFENGIDLQKKWTDNINAADDQSHFYTVVNANLFDNVNDYINVTGEDAIYLDDIEVNTGPSLDLDDLQYINNWQIGRGITVSGTKTDSLGTHNFPLAKMKSGAFWKRTAITLLKTVSIT